LIGIEGEEVKVRGEVGLEEEGRNRGRGGEEW